MIDIALVQTPPWGLFAPPLGLAYLATYVEAAGFKVKIFDLNIKLYNQAFDKGLWDFTRKDEWSSDVSFVTIRDVLDKEITSCVEEILSTDSTIIGLSINQNSLLFSLELAKRIKEATNKFIIVGGWGCYNKHERDLLRRHGLIDAFVIGEGEESLCELLSCIKNKKKIDGIEGVLVGENDGMDFFERPGPKALNKVPFPTYHQFNLADYQSPVLCILSSRGCIGRCAFCNDRVYQGQLRCRNPQEIVQELEYHVCHNAIRNFCFNDLLINGDLQHLDAWCTLVINKNLECRWTAQALARPDMSLDLLYKMKKAGCDALQFGIESGSNSILRRMKKAFNVADAEKVLAFTHKVGIEVWVNLIVGFPGESEKNFAETITFIKQNRENIDRIGSVNTCNVVFHSDLMVHKEPYDVILSDRQELLELTWYTADGNSNELRGKRARRLITALREVDLSISQDNLFLLPDKKSNTAIRNAGSFDFLIVNLPPWGQDNPHIGLGYLCSYLRGRGIDTKLIDLNKRLSRNHPDFGMLWHVENKNFWSNEKTFPLLVEIFEKEIESALQEIFDSKPEAIGFSVVDPKERLTIEFIKRLKVKLPYIKIILGGPATSTQEQRQIFLNTIGELIDVFVVGEGEEACYEVLKRIREKEALGGVYGTIIRNDGNWSYTPIKPIESLEKLTFPTYEEFDMELYGKSLLVEWSRGCYGRCAFCKNWRIMPVYRAKSPQWIVEELSYHNRNYGIDEFTVVDSIMNGHPKQLYEICSLLIEKKLQISWSGQIAPRKDMDYGFFKHMREAGCRKLQIGVESGSSKVLKNMRKAYTATMAEATLRNAKKAGIETEIFIIVGFPGEDKREFKKTYNFIKRNQKYIDTIKSINTLHLIAGTDTYEKSSESFNMKPLLLEKGGWHYQWETNDGNNYPVRRERAKQLLDLSRQLGIKVMETNICEGKENLVETLQNVGDTTDRLKILKESINYLQELPQKTSTITKRRTILKWCILVSVSFYAFFYIVYFWLYMILRKKVLLGAKPDHV